MDRRQTQKWSAVTAGAAVPAATGLRATTVGKPAFVLFHTV